jgi:hypothetical protein
MKAYMVRYAGEEWCDLTHAKNSRDARVQFWQEWANEGEYIDTRARREPLLDDLPLIGKNIVEAGYDDGWIHSRSYVCTCELCQPSGSRSA